jgi:hypothetical protein
VHNYNRKTQIIGKSFFGVCSAMIMTVSVINAIAWYVEERVFPGSNVIYYVTISAELMCMVISCSCIFLYSLAEDMKGNYLKLSFIGFIPVLIELILLIVNIFHPIMFYIDEFNPLDKAGSYGIQELPDGILDKYEGSFENIVGLAPEAVVAVLEQLGYKKSEV